MVEARPVDHPEGRLVAEEEGDRGHLLIPAQAIKISWEAVLTPGSIGPAEVSAAMPSATVATHASWPGHCNTNSVIGPHKLLASIKVVESERQVIDPGWPPVVSVDKPVLEHVSAGLHGTCTSNTTTDRSVESASKPAATAAPAAVVDVRPMVGVANCGHDQIDAAATKVTHTCPPDSLLATSRSKTTKIVDLDSVPLEVQDSRTATTESAEMTPVASHRDLVREATSTTSSTTATATTTAAGAAVGATTLEVGRLTVRRAAGKTRSSELPAPTITMSLKGNATAVTPPGALCLGLVQIAELPATRRAARTVGRPVRSTPMADFLPVSCLI